MYQSRPHTRRINSTEIHSDPFSQEATGGFEWNNNGILTGHGITGSPPVKVIPFGWRKRIYWMNSLWLVVGDSREGPDYGSMQMRLYKQ